MNIKKMTDKQIINWLEETKNEIKKMDEYKNLNEDQLNHVLMDALFEGFVQGEYHRTDLKRMANLLGFEVFDEFMNDPHPDPIDVKAKEKK